MVRGKQRAEERAARAAEKAAKEQTKRQEELRSYKSLMRVRHVVYHVILQHMLVSS